MAEPTPFATAFEQLRIARGLKPAELARELGEYEGNISRWRRGGGIELAKVRKIANYFGVDATWLESLAGYRDSDRSLARETSEAERQIWRARYDQLMEKKVPRWAWNAYMDACDALADAFRSATPGGLNSADRPALNRSAGESDVAEPRPELEDLADAYRRRAPTQQFTKLLRAPAASA